MKRIFVILLLISAGFISGAQDIKVHRHAHSWVGGTCCHGGTQTTLTIKIPGTDWKKFDSLTVCTGTEILRYSYSQLTQSNIADTLVITVKYKYSYNERTDKYRDIISPVKPCSGYLWLLKGYTRKELSVTSTSESIVALP